MPIVSVNNRSIPYIENEIALSFLIKEVDKNVLGTLHENISIEPSVYLFPYKLVEELEEIYIFVNPQKVRTFLLSESNKDLMPILKEAPEYIYRVFGRVPVYLELHHDPDELWDELFITIKTSLPAEEAIKRQKELFDIWFSNIICMVGNRLNYMEEPL